MGRLVKHSFTRSKYAPPLAFLTVNDEIQDDFRCFGNQLENILAVFEMREHLEEVIVIVLGRLEELVNLARSIMKWLEWDKYEGLPLMPLSDAARPMPFSVSNLVDTATLRWITPKLFRLRLT